MYEAHSCACGGHIQQLHCMPQRTSRRAFYDIRKVRTFLYHKKQPFSWRTVPTERVGFEPTRPCGQTVFKTASLWPLRYLSTYSVCASHLHKWYSNIDCFKRQQKFHNSLKFLFLVICTSYLAFPLYWFLYIDFIHSLSKQILYSVLWLNVICRHQL